jgi:large subunit ribosomal protein L4
MTIDVVNAENAKVGSLDLSDQVFGGRVKVDLIWQSVVRANAAERRGTHATKNRALVSGSGKKPWRQKGTGRARVGEIRNPLWRKGGTVFGPVPRSYEFAVPRKVERGAIRAALSQKLRDGAVVVVETLPDVKKAKAAAELLRRLGAIGRTVVVDVKPSDDLALAVRNLDRTHLVASGRVTARDLAGAQRIIVTRAAIERWQEVLS